MLWIVLSLLAGLGDATLYALMKKAKDMGGVLVVFIQYLFAVPILFVLLLFFYPESINANVYWLSFVNAILLALAMKFLFRAFQASDLSLTIPLLSFTPLFLLVTSPIMVGEEPASTLGYGGIILIVAGAYVLNLDPNKKNFFAPFLALFVRKGPRYALACAFLMSIMSNLFKIGINYSNPFFYSFLVHALVPIILLPFILFNFSKNFEIVKKNIKYAIGMGAANAFMGITAGIALLTAIVPYMISLKRSSVLWGMLYSHFWFKESNLKGRLLGASVMLIGVIMIIFS